MACDRPERHLQPPALRLGHRGHPIKAPPPAQPAQPVGDRIQSLRQVRLIGRLGQPAPPPPRARQRPNQHIGALTPTPPDRRIGQFHPVPLGFSPWRVFDHRPVGRCGLLARPAHRAQRPLPYRAGKRRIRTREAQRDDLVEQRRGPQMRIRGQPQPAIFDILGEQVRRQADTNPRGVLPGQIPAHRQPGHPQMAGDRADRPALTT